MTRRSTSSPVRSRNILTYSRSIRKRRQWPVLPLATCGVSSCQAGVKDGSGFPSTQAATAAPTVVDEAVSDDRDDVEHHVHCLSLRPSGATVRRMACFYTPHRRLSELPNEDLFVSCSVLFGDAEEENHFHLPRIRSTRSDFEDDLDLGGSEVDVMIERSVST